MSLNSSSRQYKNYKILDGVSLMVFLTLSKFADAFLSSLKEKATNPKVDYVV